MTSKDLWTLREAQAQDILVPDEVDEERGDFHFFFGMLTPYHVGIYWGFPRVGRYCLLAPAVKAVAIASLVPRFQIV